MSLDTCVLIFSWTNFVHFLVWGTFNFPALISTGNLCGKDCDDLKNILKATMIDIGGNNVGLCMITLYPMLLLGEK